MLLSKRIKDLSPEVSQLCSDRKIIPDLIFAQELVKEVFGTISMASIKVDSEQMVIIEFTVVDKTATEIGEAMTRYESAWGKYVPRGRQLDIGIRPHKI